ncbi:MAG: hypothetical protein LBP99_09635 [Azoarcus sp.]|jgi:hypothetical protein|nr:hypothetical protein [Azoarcus sp.]
MKLSFKKTTAKMVDHIKQIPCLYFVAFLSGLNLPCRASAQWMPEACFVRVFT